MKRSIVIMIAIAALMAGSVMAQDLGCKGKMLAGGYAGYTLGLGDPFGDEEYVVFGVTAKSSYSAGIGFGGTFHYGVAPKFMVGGELGLQNYSVEVDIPAQTIMGQTIPATKEEESSMETNILGSCLYALNYTDDGAMFINFGAGLYGGGESEIGFFGGILYQKKLSESMNWFVMPRFHYVMTDTAMKMFQIAAGVNFSLGN